MLRDIVRDRNESVYSLSKKSGIPYSTLADLLSGKTDIRDSSSKVLYCLSKSLGVSMEDLYLCEDTQDYLYIYNEGHNVLIDYRDQHISYEGPKNLVAFKELLKLSDGKVAHIDTYYKDTDGTIYQEEEFIDLEDIFNEYGYSIRGVSADQVHIGKPSSSRREQLIDGSIMVSDNMVILPSDDPAQPETVLVVSLSRPDCRALVRLSNYAVLLSNMSERMKERASEAVSRNIELIRSELEERRHRA